MWDTHSIGFLSTEDDADIILTYGDDEITVAEFNSRPFMFEHLNGLSEPKAWGPKYPQTLAGVEKWRKLEKKRELTKDEVRQYGAAVGEAIRKLNRPTRYADVQMHCTVQNTCKGRDNTQVGEDRRYAAYVDRLNAERLARRQGDWLDRKIVAALEREFAIEFAPTKADRENWRRAANQVHEKRAKARLNAKIRKRAA